MILSHPIRSRHNAFTLIELLVVISIIALLIALLLPALSAARKTARTIQCLSNQRQGAIAMAVYQSDFDGFYTPVFPELPSTSTSWSLLLFNDQYLSDARVFDCPTHDARYNPSSYTPNWSEANDPNNSLAQAYWISKWPEFGYNIYHIGSNYRHTGDYTSPARAGQLDDAANTIMFADSVRLYSGGPRSAPGGLIGWYGLVDYYNATAGRLDPRHNGNSLNVIWADAHGTTESVNDPDNAYDNGLTDTNDADNYWDRQ